MNFSRLLYQHIFWRGWHVLSSLVLNILIARVFDAGPSGLLFYQISAYSLIIQLLSFSLESGIGYYMARKEVNISKQVSLSVAWTLLSALIFAGLFPFFTNILKLPTNYPVFFPVAFFVGNLLISFCNLLFYSRFRFIFPSATALIVNLIMILLLCIHQFWYPFFSDGEFTITYFLAYLLHGLVMLLGVFIVLRTRITSIPSADQLKRIFRYASYAFFANLLFFLLNRVDYWFIRLYCSPADLGNYIQVSKIVQLFFLLPSMVSTVIFPIVAGGRSAALTGTIRILSVALLVLYSIACLILALTGNWLFPWLYGESFSNMYIPFLLMIPGILAISILYPYTAYYSGTNRIGVNIRGCVMALLVVITADALLIPYYGMRAAALIASTGFCIFQFYVFSVFRREFYMSIRSMFSLNRYEWMQFKNTLKFRA